MPTKRTRHGGHKKRSRKIRMKHTKKKRGKRLAKKKALEEIME